MLRHHQQLVVAGKISGFWLLHKHNVLRACAFHQKFSEIHQNSPEILRNPSLPHLKKPPNPKPKPLIHVSIPSVVFSGSLICPEV